MKKDIQKYENYKDSGIEWIGDIPEHWVAVPMRFLLRQRITDGPHETPKFLPNGIPFLSVDGIQDGELFFEGCRKISKEDHEKYKEKCVVEKHDILMGKAASVGKVAQVKVDFEFSIWSPLALLKPNHDKITSAYFEYFLKSKYAKDNANILSTFNTQQNISMTDISRIYYVIPNTVEEQTAIATYLDRKTAEIDELIADKKRLIELYEEEKTAVINDLVTGKTVWNGASTSSAPGAWIEPTEVKDSGIEWLPAEASSQAGLGDASTGSARRIPEDWEVKKLKYVANLKSGSNIVSQQIKEEGIYPVFGGNGLRGYFNDFTHEGNFVLIGKQGAHCGNIKYAKGKFWASEHAIVVRPLITYEINYIGELLRLMNLNQYSVSAAQPGLSVDTIKNLYIILPPLETQRRIVQKIETETARINAKKEKAEKLIALLTEYREALISEVVTGKIKII